MPLYEYLCDACGKRFEVIQKFSDPAPEACRVCGKGPVQRMASSPAIQFKGTGWYITDYAQKGKSEGKSEGSGSGSSSAPAAETKASDSKTSDSSTASTTSTAPAAPSATATKS